MPEPQCEAHVKEGSEPEDERAKKIGRKSAAKES